jgi:hypothetical protein
MQSQAPLDPLPHPAGRLAQLGRRTKPYAVREELVQGHRGRAISWLLRNGRPPSPERPVRVPAMLGVEPACGPGVEGAAGADLPGAAPTAEHRSRSPNAANRGCSHRPAGRGRSPHGGSRRRTGNGPSRSGTVVGGGHGARPTSAAAVAGRFRRSRQDGKRVPRWISAPDRHPGPAPGDGSGPTGSRSRPTRRCPQPPPAPWGFPRTGRPGQAR